MATRRISRKARPASRRARANNKNTKVWSREEIAFLRKHYRNCRTTWCARKLGRTVYSVRYKASNLSIRKTTPSNWVTPGQTKTAHSRPTRKTMRQARTRRNNRRARW